MCHKSHLTSPLVFTCQFKNECFFIFNSTACVKVKNWENFALRVENMSNGRRTLLSVFSRNYFPTKTYQLYHWFIIHRFIMHGVVKITIQSMFWLFPFSFFFPIFILLKLISFFPFTLKADITFVRFTKETFNI